MRRRIFKANDGLLAEDLVHCGLDHLTASKTLFHDDPSHYDSAGYLAHIGVELLLKGWLLESTGQFEGDHILANLYKQLVEQANAPDLIKESWDVLHLLDQYGSLRYPNRRHPTEVGQGDWLRIEKLVGTVCSTMPRTIEDKLGKVPFGHKAGRVLTKKNVGDGSGEGT